MGGGVDKIKQVRKFWEGGEPVLVLLVAYYSTYIKRKYDHLLKTIYQLLQINIAKCKIVED